MAKPISTAARTKMLPTSPMSAATLAGELSRHVVDDLMNRVVPWTEVRRGPPMLARVITDGWLGYENPPANPHEVRVVEGQKAHELFKWVHRVFSNLKRWAKGVFHGLRKAHVQRYLDKFVLSWNRRRHTRIALDRLLWIGMGLGPATYRDFVDQRI